MGMKPPNPGGPSDRVLEALLIGGSTKHEICKMTGLPMVSVESAIYSQRCLGNITRTDRSAPGMHMHGFYAEYAITQQGIRRLGETAPEERLEALGYRKVPMSSVIDARPATDGQGVWVRFKVA